MVQGQMGYTPPWLDICYMAYFMGSILLVIQKQI
jgi:hypothetical protein